MKTIEINNWGKSYCSDDLIDALFSFREQFGEIDIQWNMSIEHLRTVMKSMYNTGWNEGLSGESALLGYPIVISDCNKITISERHIAPEPLVTTGDIISLTCVNCAAPLKTMTCEYCGTVHKRKGINYE